jgi:GDP-4-dehydro-6-deoxy-D-mannose reductase
MTHHALITGISGFAGGFLAEHLLSLGDAVLGMSPDGAWTAASPPALAGRVDVLPWDIAEPDGLDDDVRRRIEDFQPDAIYHLAALSVPDDCGDRETTPEAAATNVEGTRRVLELAAMLGGPLRVLLTSSSHVYAPVSREDPLVDEDAPLGPTRGYGKTKLAAERLAQEAFSRGVDVVIARAFQHAGPRQSPRMMLSQWARQFAAADQPVEIYTRDAHVDLTDVRDVVRAYRLLVERGGSGEVYNVGSSQSRRTGDLVEMLRRLADPDRVIVELRPGRKQDAIADITRLTEQTGWRPAIPIEQTVADTWEYWRLV